MVSPARDPFSGSSDVLHLPHEAASLRRARVFVCDVIEGWGVLPVTDAALPTSEVVTNAIVHTTGHVVLRVRRLDGHARVEVHDADPAPPKVNADDPSRPGGFGMRLVDALTACWGVDEIEGDGKVVWFDLELQRRP